VSDAAFCTLPALIVLAAACSAVSANDEQKDFDTRLGEARENVETEAGKAYYEGPFFKAFYESYAERLSQCMRHSEDSEESDFELLIQLTAIGTVEATMVRPESGFATCFAGLVNEGSYPEPPSAGFWLPVGIVLSD
jgi:hypothetical protein